MDVKTKLQECELANRQRGKRVTILGAGIAGLVAAYELERLGHEVEIIEGSPRVGGRIWTHRFGEEADAPYGELGAMRLPKEHRAILHYIYKMDLGEKLCKFPTVFEERNALMNIEGKICRMKDAPKLFEQRYREIFPPDRYSENTRLFAAWMKTIIEAISPGTLRAGFDRDLKSHLMDELEKLDLTPFFNEDGYTIDLQKFLKTHPNFRRSCHKALDIFLGDIVVEISHDLLQLEGGMDQLVKRLVASVKAPIQCNSEVVALHVRDHRVDVSWLENGESRTRSCDYVLCTIPFSILGKIERTGFDERKEASIRNAVYCPATKVAFHCAEAFWEKEGIRGGASFSGEGIRQTYYPSIRFNPSLGSALLASYTIGDDAERLGLMSDEQRCSYVKDTVSHIHPEINAPGMVVAAATIAWGHYKWGGGGCTIPWGGDLSNESDHSLQYLEAARPQDRLFFAGEHCSKYPAWLEGSIESALEAVYGIVSYR